MSTGEAPTDAYYGVRTLRAIENFYISNSKISGIPEFVRGMMMMKRAATLANKGLQTIPKSAANATVATRDEVLNNGRCIGQFPVDVFQGGAGTPINMDTNKVLVNIGFELMGHRKGEYQYLNPNDHISKHQSTNNAYPAGFHIVAYASILKLIDAIKQLGEDFQAKAVESQDILKMDRTQLQDAASMTFGQEFHASNMLFNEETKSTLCAAELLLGVNLGAITIGTRLNTSDGYQQLAVQKSAGVGNLLVAPAEDLIEVTSDYGAYVMVHSSLKRPAARLSKICNDLCPPSSDPRAGLNEINLPELQAGFSIMPAEANPVALEVINQICLKVIGGDITMTTASKVGQLQLSVMELAIGQAIFESTHILTDVYYNLLEKCANDITTSKAVYEGYIYNSVGTIAYLNPSTGYRNGDTIGKIYAETGKGIREVVLKRGLLTTAELDDIFSTQNLMHPARRTKRYTDESGQ